MHLILELVFYKFKKFIFNSKGLEILKSSKF